jgi:hypothetical protein
MLGYIDPNFFGVISQIGFIIFFSVLSGFLFFFKTIKRFFTWLFGCIANIFRIKSKH